MSKTVSIKAKTKVTRSSKPSRSPGTQHKRVLAAAREGVHAALRAHKKAGHSIIVYQGGKVVRIPPRKIDV